MYMYICNWHSMSVYANTLTLWQFKLHVIYVTWAGVICLICTHEPEGAQRPRASADISGKSRLPMLHMLCNTSGI